MTQNMCEPFEMLFMLSLNYQKMIDQSCLVDSAQFGPQVPSLIIHVI